MKVFGVMITYRRPDAVAAYLRCLARQPRVLDHLLVMDNSADDETRRVVEEHQGRPTSIEYLAMDDNLGPAGGIAAGMNRVLQLAGPDDWIVLLDDDDPPWADDILGRLRDFALEATRLDPRTAGVALDGAVWNPHRARLRRPSPEGPAVPVDYLAGGGFPYYRVQAIREVGVPDARLFFGFDDLEIGLRLGHRGYRLFLDCSLVRERAMIGAGGPEGSDGTAKLQRILPTWRRYYGVRNLLHLARSSDGFLTAAKVTVLYGVASPLMAVLQGERNAGARLRLSLQACVDGWRGRLGRTVEPDAANVGVSPAAHPF